MNIFQSLFGGGQTVDLKGIINENTFFVDVRNPEEFAAGSVNGAVNIPLDKIASQFSKFKNKHNIIVFCRSGNRSAQAKLLLEKNGFSNIVNGGTWENVRLIIQQKTNK